MIVWIQTIVQYSRQMNNIMECIYSVNEYEKTFDCNINGDIIRYTRDVYVICNNMDPCRTEYLHLYYGSFPDVVFYWTDDIEKATWFNRQEIAECQLSDMIENPDNYI